MADTIVQRFIETAQRHQTKLSVLYPQSHSSHNKVWLELNWSDYQILVETIASGLISLGVEKNDRIAILSGTRLEWAALDLAIMGIGAVTIPIYANSTSEDIGFILNNSQTKIVFVENVEHLKKMAPTLNGKTHRNLEKIVLIDKATKSLTKLTSQLPQQVSLTSLDELQELGKKTLKTNQTLYTDAVNKTALHDVATIIYTSGTSGQPRGAVHTHQQIMSEVTEAFPLLGVNNHDRTMTFLPFAHVLGRIEIWGHALIGYTLGFASSIETLKNDFTQIRPTIMVAVPRIFEKIYAGILSQVEISPLKRRLFDWAFQTGRAVSQCKQERRAIPLTLALQYASARKLVFDPILERMGGRLRFAVSGGAPLNQEIAELFHAAGILVLEGYGLTETMAAVCVNTPFEYQFGTVGKPMGDVKIKFAEDGEILIRSNKVMREYLDDPAATNSALRDGWFHTGDIGELTPNGYLKITDRKKDLIKTAGGKYIAPQRLEALIKRSPLVSQVHIHGDNRKYCIALITITDEARKKANFENLIQSVVASANSHLASYETIKRFSILEKDFSIESGELTASLKIRRKTVDTHYHNLIEGLYK